MPSPTPQHLQAYGDLLEPSEAAEPILAKPVRQVLGDWLRELRSEDELKAVDLKPRHKALLKGKPGTGKTTLAHHLAARLGLPMLVVAPEKLIDCWLGSTARNIRHLFDAARDQKQPFVLFFDEFDALGFKRQDAASSAGQEQNAFVNTLLKCIEKHAGLTIAATNHGDRLDPAIWRRFDLHLTLELPGQFEREQILQRYLKPYGLPRRAMAAFAEAFAEASPALMRQFCEMVRREFVLGPKCDRDMRREAVFDRLVVSVQPHPDHGKPRLWSHGGSDSAVRQLPWPLPLAKDVKEEPPPPAATPTVLPFRPAKAAGAGP